MPEKLDPEELANIKELLIALGCYPKENTQKILKKRRF